MTASRWGDEMSTMPPARIVGVATDTARGTVHTKTTSEVTVRGWARHRAAVALAVTSLAGLLAGCGGVSEQRVGDDDLRFFVHDRELLPSDGMDAQVGGTLAAADGCVLFEQGGSRFPVVWPSGTSVAGTDPLVIELPSGERLDLGDQVLGGGGYLSAETLSIDVPDACLNEHGEVAVFNPDDDPVRDSS